MKGTMVKCMEELVIEKFGAWKWKESVEKAGVPEGRIFTTLCDIDEALLWSKDDARVRG